MSYRRRVLASALPLAGLLLLATAPAQAQRGGDDRSREAVRMCIEQAEDILRDRGNRREVELDDIRDIDRDDEVIKVQGWLRVYEGDGDRRRAWLDCDVSFRGENRVVYFDEESFLTSNRDSDSWRPRRDSDRDWDRARRWDRGRDWGRREDWRDDRRSDRRSSNLREDAQQACRRLVREQGYDVADVSDRDRTENGMRLDMRLRRNDRRWDATCAYNGNQDEARLVRLDPDNNRNR
jgi:hypothetical protein